MGVGESGEGKKLQFTLRLEKDSETECGSWVSLSGYTRLYFAPHTWLSLSKAHTSHERSPHSLKRYTAAAALIWVIGRIGDQLKSKFGSMSSTSLSLSITKLLNWD